MSGGANALAHFISISLSFAHDAGRHLPSPGRPHAAGRLRAALRRGADGVGAEGGVRGQPAGDLTASGGAEGGGTGGRTAARALRLLPDRARRAGAAGRLDRAHPRLLARAHRAAEGRAEEDGSMSDVAADTDALTFEAELDAPPDQVWRALSEPEVGAAEVVGGEPGSRLDLAWPTRDGDSLVSFEIAAGEGGGTHLVIVHRAPAMLAEVLPFRPRARRTQLSSGWRMAA